MINMICYVPSDNILKRLNFDRKQQFLLTFVLGGSIIIIEAKAFIGAFVRSARHKKAEEIVRGSSDAPVIKS